MKALNFLVISAFLCVSCQDDTLAVPPGNHDYPHGHGTCGIDPCPSDGFEPSPGGVPYNPTPNAGGSSGVGGTGGSGGSGGSGGMAGGAGSAGSGDSGGLSGSTGGTSGDTGGLGGSTGNVDGSASADSATDGTGGSGGSPIDSGTNYAADGGLANCHRTRGYWVNHPTAWPVTSLTLGDNTYTQDQLLAILGYSTYGNGLTSLASQLIAAKLNGATADDQVIGATIKQADAMIGDLVIVPIGDGYLNPAVTTAYVTALDTYNHLNECK